MPSSERIGPKNAIDVKFFYTRICCQILTMLVALRHQEKTPLNNLSYSLELKSHIKLTLWKVIVRIWMDGNSKTLRILL